MKIKYLPLFSFALITVILVSCTKGNQNPAPSPSVNPVSSPVSNSVSSPLTGKWQQTKLVTYLLDTNGARLYDTTYLQPFTNADYVQFNNNGTCVLSVDHYYYLNEPGMSVPTPIPTLITNFHYTPAGLKFVLVPQNDGASPGGNSVADTASMLDNNTLLIHTVATGIGPTYHIFITDSYFSKPDAN